MIAQVLARAVACHELADEGGVTGDRVGVGSQLLELVLVAGGGAEAAEEAAHAVGAGVPALGVPAATQQGGRRLEDADDLTIDAFGTQGAAEGEIAIGHALAVDDRDAPPGEGQLARHAAGVGDGLAHAVALVPVTQYSTSSGS